MAVEVVPCQPQDLVDILPTLRPSFLEEMKGLKLALPANAHAVTIRKDGAILGIVGGHPASFGVLQAWALISTQASLAPLAFTRSIHLLVGKFLEKQYHRVQMSVRCGCEAECRWAELLGFKPEGVMKQYGPDKKDYWLFGRVA